MARYNLIIKDQTFVRLLALASLEGKTFGKFVNTVLDKISEGAIEHDKTEQGRG